MLGVISQPAVVFELLVKCNICYSQSTTGATCVCDSDLVPAWISLGGARGAFCPLMKSFPPLKLHLNDELAQSSCTHNQLKY